MRNKKCFQISFMYILFNILTISNVVAHSEPTKSTNNDKPLSIVEFSLITVFVLFIALWVSIWLNRNEFLTKEFSKTKVVIIIYVTTIINLVLIAYLYLEL